jgi:hypothetical protein
MTRLTSTRASRPWSAASGWSTTLATSSTGVSSGSRPIARKASLRVICRTHPRGEALRHVCRFRHARVIASCATSSASCRFLVSLSASRSHSARRWAQFQFAGPSMFPSGGIICSKRF